MIEITQERLRELFSYDPETGLFTRRISTGRRGCHRAGFVAGCIKKGDGYRVLHIDGRLYYAHRLAWLYVHGHWPGSEIDHISGDRGDNRLANLREATPAQNRRNQCLSAANTSGFKGVTRARRGKPWQAQIKVNRKYLYLGVFDTPEEAHAAYMAAAREHFGEFARVSLFTGKAATIAASFGL